MYKGKIQRALWIQRLNDYSSEIEQKAFVLLLIQAPFLALYPKLSITAKSRIYQTHQETTKIEQNMAMHFAQSLCYLIVKDIEDL